MKEKGVPAIEQYCYEEHEMIRRAATECMCNMAQCKDVGTCLLVTDSIAMSLNLYHCGTEV